MALKVLYAWSNLRVKIALKCSMPWVIWDCSKNPGVCSMTRLLLKCALWCRYWIRLIHSCELQFTYYIHYTVYSRRSGVELVYSLYTITQIYTSYIYSVALWYKYLHLSSVCSRQYLHLSSLCSRQYLHLSSLCSRQHLHLSSLCSKQHLHLSSLFYEKHI